MKDTSDEFEAIRRARLMARSPLDRLRMGCDMFDTAEALASASLRHLDGVERRIALFERFYGDDFDARAKAAIVARLRARDAGRDAGPDAWAIRPGRTEDVPALEACARAAYAKYVARIGGEPAPMNADFDAAVANGQVHVAERDGTVIGYAVVRADGPVLRLENVAVLPAHAGRGVGRRLVAFVERCARTHGHAAIELYTNARMHENLAMYPRFGYVETDRRREDGFDRVYFRKVLLPDGPSDRRSDGSSNGPRDGPSGG